MRTRDSGKLKSTVTDKGMTVPDGVNAMMVDENSTVPETESISYRNVKRVGCGVERHSNPPARQWSIAGQRNKDITRPQYLEYLIGKCLNKENMFNMSSIFQSDALKNLEKKFLSGCSLVDVLPLPHADAAHWRFTLAENCGRLNFHVMSSERRKFELVTEKYGDITVRFESSTSDSTICLC